MSKYQSHTKINTNIDNNTIGISNATLNNEISGYLYKKSSNGTYQKRYFEINGTYLTYYKTDKMTKLLAALSISQVGAIRLLGEVEDGVEFEIDLKDRKYILKADSFPEANKWVTFLIEIRDQKSNLNHQMNNFSNNSSTDDRTPLSTTEAISPAVIHKSSRNCCSYFLRRFCN